MGRFAIGAPRVGGTAAARAAGAADVAGAVGAVGFTGTAPAADFAGVLAAAGAASACTVCRVMAFSTSPGLEIPVRSILVLISPGRGRAADRAARDAASCAASACTRKCWRTFSASSGSMELECVFFSLTPIFGSKSRTSLLLTSSSRARSLMRTFSILPASSRIPRVARPPPAGQPHGRRLVVVLLRWRRCWQRLPMHLTHFLNDHMARWPHGHMLGISRLLFFHRLELLSRLACFAFRGFSRRR